eukprot:GHVU01219449.1.p1 GENE.GHVU01219449.1~~GHVU01219449.1.p1  ORF type:complete len:105 (-),score=0.91 GHVU01219449.1:603-917(-)
MVMCAYADFADRLIKHWRAGKLGTRRKSQRSDYYTPILRSIAGCQRHFDGSGWAEASPCSVFLGRSDDSIRGIDMIHIRGIRECVSTAGLTDLEARSPLEEAST